MNVPSSAHTSSNTPSDITRGVQSTVRARPAGRLSFAHELRALWLWQSSRGSAHSRSAAWMLRRQGIACRGAPPSTYRRRGQGPQGMPQGRAPRAGRSRAPWSCTPCRPPSREAHGWRISEGSTANRTRQWLLRGQLGDFPDPPPAARAPQLAGPSRSSGRRGSTTRAPRPRLLTEVSPGPHGAMTSPEYGPMFRVARPGLPRRQVGHHDRQPRSPPRHPPPPRRSARRAAFRDETAHPCLTSMSLGPGLLDGRSTAGGRAHWISHAGLVLLAPVEIGVSMTLRARCRTAAAAGAFVYTFSTTRLPTCQPQKSSESDSSRSEWTPQSSRHSATISRSGTGAFVLDMGPGSNGMPRAVSARRRAVRLPRACPPRIEGTGNMRL